MAARLSTSFDSLFLAHLNFSSQNQRNQKRSKKREPHELLFLSPHGVFCALFCLFTLAKHKLYH